MVKVTEAAVTAAREFVAEVTTRKFAASRAAGEFENAVLSEAESLSQFALGKESRTYCILVVSFLEDVFQRNFIERWAIKTPTKANEFFGSNGPLNTFAQRVTIAAGLGWVPQNFHTEAALVRKIRNEFAHNHKVHSLTQEPVRSWASQLQPTETIWINDQRPSYKNAYENSDLETRLRMRVFTTAMHLIGQTLARAKIIANELPAEYREGGYFGLTDIEQGMIDVMIRHCFLTLDLSPSED